MASPFDDERLRGAKSALVKMTPDKLGRFEFELWVQYTRLGLHSLNVGDLVGVENYTPGSNESRTYSVLTLTQVFPFHFANQGSDAYPGHVFESMRSIKEDWEKQSDRPLHPTTTIRASAVSTSWQFSYSDRDAALPKLTEEENLPMPGADVRPLSMEMVDAIINQGLQQEPASPFRHREFENIPVRLDVEALLTTHFGIFGFTGVGKSNLVSSVVYSLTNPTAPKRASVVVIDPNDEYLGLLIDRIAEGPQEMLYVHVGTDSLPVPLIGFIGEGAPPPTPAAMELLLNQMKLPAALRTQDVRGYFRRVLTANLSRIRIALPAENLSSLISQKLLEETPEKAGQAVRHAITDIKEEWIRRTAGQAISSQSLEVAVQSLNTPGTGIRFTTPSMLALAGGGSEGTANGILNRTIADLQRIGRDLGNIPDRAVIPMRTILESLNDRDRRTLVILAGRRDSELKSYTEILGNRLYEERRRHGIMEPTVLFLFDEADLFLPLQASDEETERVKDFCVTLARRGRKFHLGIGIATQRATLLDTEVMGNLHTYFVSKLPRQGDRERVAEAFGIGEDQLAPTFTFRPGNWLVISHDSTGLKGVPIPTIASDANARILTASRRGGAN